MHDFPVQQVLGIRFFVGNVEDAVELLFQKGGVLIAPSGTCFARLRTDPAYRMAVGRADVAIPDSGAMVLMWNAHHKDKLTRISGLKYVRCLITKIRPSGRRGFWILPNAAARSKLAAWFNSHGFEFRPDDLYVAPQYGPMVEDLELVSRIEARRPDDVIVGIGSGPQEKLGPYLREQLSYRPAIHCIGAALGFVTGDQVHIPEWADRYYLGWLLRLFAQPRIFVPRLGRALKLPWLILRYGESLPPMKRQEEAQW